MGTEVAYLESKVTNLEKNLPDMIKEIFEYFIQKKDQQDRELYVSHTELSQAVRKKLDVDVFKAYEGRQIAVRNTDNSVMQLDEKCHKLDRKFLEYTTAVQIQEML